MLSFSYAESNSDPGSVCQKSVKSLDDLSLRWFFVRPVIPRVELDVHPAFRLPVGREKYQIVMHEPFAVTHR